MRKEREDSDTNISMQFPYMLNIGVNSGYIKKQQQEQNMLNESQKEKSSCYPRVQEFYLEHVLVGSENKSLAGQGEGHVRHLVDLGADHKVLRIIIDDDGCTLHIQYKQCSLTIIHFLVLEPYPIHTEHLFLGRNKKKKRFCMAQKLF